jgi:hypothetical protein
MKRDLYAMALHLAVGAAMGYASFWLGNSIYSAVVAFFIGYAMKSASARIFGVKEFNWWFANGGIVYVFTWFVVWVVLFNM